MSKESKSRLVANPSIVMQLLPEGAVLMDSASGNCFELNRIGVEIWKALRLGRSSTEIEDELIGRYSVDRATVSSDIEALIEDLARQGVLVVAQR